MGGARAPPVPVDPMAHVKKNIYYPQEQAEREVASRDATFQYAVRRMHEHDGETIARHRWKNGKSTGAVVRGSPTERWTVKDGKLIKRKTDLGRSLSRTV